MSEHSEIGWAYGVIYDDLGSCGCGYFDGRLELLRDVLQEFSSDIIDSRSKYSSPLAEWFLCLMDKAGLLEHGGTIRWSWVTDKGERLLAVLTDAQAWAALLADSVGYCQCGACS